MAKRLAGRIALVTGSSSGLGQAIAVAFAQEGAVLFCVDLYPSERNPVNSTTGKADDFNNRVSGQGTHEKIRQAGGEATYHRADLTKARDVELAVRACVSRYGRLDIMVNNAGMFSHSVAQAQLWQSFTNTRHLGRKYTYSPSQGPRDERSRLR